MHVILPISQFAVSIGRSLLLQFSYTILLLFCKQFRMIRVSSLSRSWLLFRRACQTLRLTWPVSESHINSNNIYHSRLQCYFSSEFISVLVFASLFDFLLYFYIMSVMSW